MNKYKNNLMFYLSLICAIWFALVGMVWTFWIPLFIGYPFGFLSYYLWKKLDKKEQDRKRNKIIPIVLKIGFVLSLISLIGLLLFDK